MPRRDDSECGSEREHAAIRGHLHRVTLASLLDDTRRASTLLARTESGESARTREVTEEQYAPAPTRKQGERANGGCGDDAAHTERASASGRERDHERDDDGDREASQHVSRPRACAPRSAWNGERGARRQNYAPRRSNALPAASPAH